jgi:8-oxo-dGTP diphosphatase
VIEAAGGVVWRYGSKGQVKVLLVHRRRQDDWSLPKGRRRAGERSRTCALREVREETGLRCELGPELPAVDTVDRHGRRRRARYWVMEPIAGQFRPSAEVDVVHWFEVDHAAALLASDREVSVLGELLDLLPVAR